MARIYLDARSMSGGMSGVGRYCLGLVPELAAQAPGHDFVVLRSRIGGDEPVANAPNVREVVLNGPANAVPLFLSVGAIRRVFRLEGRADLYHALFHVVPAGLRQGPMAPSRVVVTLHDTIWIDAPEAVAASTLSAAWRRRLGLTLIPHALRTADHVICNSETTARNAARWVPRDKCTAIHLGVSKHFEASAPGVSTAGPSVAAPYVAAFGVAKGYKNIACLVRAVAEVRRRRPEVRLVLVGGDGGARAAISETGLADDVVVTESLDDADVRAVMRGAAAFVVPSTVEGFGLPAVEAMALGAPLVVSNIPALVEVAGGAALTFDPASPSALAAVLDRVLGDDALRRDLSARGAERARAFRWSEAAARTLAVYDGLL